MSQESNWADEEFENVSLNDKRLNARLKIICNKFSENPESPINQACTDWKETKAAYRFFQNEKVDVDEIMMAHSQKTALRAKKYKTVLALQDTSYFIYTSHIKTEGLGKLSMKKVINVDKIYSKGLIMHSCMGVTTEGLPLGLFKQMIYTREQYKNGEMLHKKKKNVRDTLPIEEKESYRWLESLSTTKALVDDTQIITVCDREADLYDFFKLSDKINSPVLVRASHNRTINRNSRYADNDVDKLWDYMTKQPVAGSYTLEVPNRSKRKNSKR